MALEIERETTEYVFVGVTGGTLPSSAEMCFLTAGTRPTAEWSAAVIVDNAHALWPDALATGLAGAYYVARLVGSFGGTGVVLSDGDYQPWVRLTGATERPVRRAPITLTVL